MEQRPAGNGYRMILRGPAETPGVVRLFTGGRTAGRITATTLDGHPLTVDAAPASDTVRLRFPNVPDGAVSKWSGVADDTVSASRPWGI